MLPSDFSVEERMASESSDVTEGGGGLGSGHDGGGFNGGSDTADPFLNTEERRRLLGDCTTGLQFSSLVETEVSSTAAQARRKSSLIKLLRTTRALPFVKGSTLCSASGSSPCVGHPCGWAELDAKGL